MNNRYTVTSFDGCLTPLLLILVLMCFALTFVGCRTSKPCLPDVEIQEVLTPYPCIIHIDVPPEPEYEEYPDWLLDGLSSKEYALEVERVQKQNRAKREAWMKAVRFLIEEHNRLEPQCKL